MAALSFEAASSAAAAAADTQADLKAMLENADFVQGRKLVNDGNYDDAIDLFTKLLETTIEQTGDDMALVVAPLYFQYGSALLIKAEESSEVFGDAVDTSEPSPSGGAEEEDVGEDAGASSSSASSSSSGGEKASVMDTAVDTAMAMASSQSATDEDVEIAWQVLELAKKIFYTHESHEGVKEILGKVHLRLGDLQKLNGKFADAVADFDKCLEIRASIFPANDRRIADVHYSLAQACEYGAAEPELADQAESFRTKSLEHYKACAAVFSSLIKALEAPKEEGAAGCDGKAGKEASPTSVTTASKEKLPPAADPCKTAELNELRDIYDELTETIAAAQEGQRVPHPADAPAGSDDGAKAGVTTIGFGAPSSASAAAASTGVTTIGFGAPSSSAAASSAGATTIGFGARSASSSSSFSAASSSSSSSSSVPSAASSSATPAPMMVVKKKKKAELSAAPSVAVAAPPAAATSTTDESDAKRPKIAAE